MTIQVLCNSDFIFDNHYNHNIIASSNILNNDTKQQTNYNSDCDVNYTTSIQRVSKATVKPTLIYRDQVYNNGRHKKKSFQVLVQVYESKL